MPHRDPRPRKESNVDTISDTSKIQAMHAMLTKYGQDFPLHSSRRHRRPAGDTILVTGTTGGLGCALLAYLVELPNVLRIYAVNRKSKVALVERQRSTLHDRGYNAQAILENGKVVLVEAATEEPQLGVSSELYGEVRVSS